MWYFYFGAKAPGSNRKVPSVFLSPVGEEATASCLRMRTERLSLEKVNKENQADALGLQDWGKQTSDVSDLRMGRAAKGFQRQNPNPEGKCHGTGRAAERKMQLGEGLT